jgi:hypothetical protein
VAQLVIDGVAVERHVTPQQGASRKRLLARTVPRLVSRHLSGPLGWRWFALMARLPLLMPRYRRRFARAEDDLAHAVQRHSYSPVDPAASSWKDFHAEHEAQMADGFIANDDSGIRTAAGDYRFERTPARRGL